MEIDFLILADAAQVADGKLYVMGGGWDRLMVNALPSLHLCGFGVGVLVPWSETNTATVLTLAVEDEDGGVLIPPLSVNIEVGRPSGLAPGAEQRALLAFNAPLQLTKLGGYSVSLALDGDVRKRLRFTVAPGPQYRPT